LELGDWSFRPGVPAQNVGGYLLPFALGNVLGPVVLGHLFDTIGRRKMITATYALSGILLAITGWLFHAERKSLEHVATPLSCKL
jgi:MFS family permease